ncbi:hypothetical protein VTK73DRAFT_6642 [Phialemonium thermophilum]|uniref:CFEM domain-containing protein n=1 Tax=Phialemonium thermophilum TaxID=223376 RepID=A0ABR3WJ11_9PEZI
MKSFVPTLLLAAGLAAAQSLTDFFPQCSIKCLEDGVKDATDCSIDDGVCMCIFDNYAAAVDDATQCVLSTCGNEVAVNTVLPAAAAFCSAVSSSHHLTGTPTVGTVAATGASTTSSSSAPASNSAESTASSSSSSSSSASSTSSSSPTPNVAAGGAGSLGLAAVLGLGAIAAF